MGEFRKLTAKPLDFTNNTPYTVLIATTTKENEVKLTTNDWNRSNPGKTPRGNGSWWLKANDGTTFCTPSNLTWTEAQKWAKAQAKLNGWTSLDLQA